MKLVKVQISAEFVVEDGDFLSPGIFGPAEMTAREWAKFNLIQAIEDGIVITKDQLNALS